MDKKNDLENQIDDLKTDLVDYDQDIFDLYDSLFETIIDEYDDKVLDLEHNAERTEAAISRRSSQAGNYQSESDNRNAYNSNITDYQGLSESAKSEIAIKEEELAKLKKQLADEVKKNPDYVNTKNYKDKIEEIYSVENDIDDLNAEIIDYLNSIFEEYENIFNSVVTEFENQLQDLQHVAERSESLISRRSSYASSHVNMSESRSASTQNITDYQSLIENMKSQKSIKESERDALTAQLQKQLNEHPEIYGTESYYSMLQQIQEVENEIDDLNSNIIDYSNSISEEYLNIFNSLNSEFENKLGIIEHQANEINNALDLAETKGRLAATGYYEALKEINQSSIDTLTEERAELENAFYTALASGEIEVGSEDYYDMQDAINGVIEKLQEAQNEVEELNIQIRQCEWDNFDYLEERISRISDECEFLIDLMSNDELYTDNGQFTDEGLATVGLRAVNYNTLMSQADDYAAEIEEIQKLIDEDNADSNLVERKEELIDAQQEAILAAEEEKQAIKSLVEDGIEKEISSLSDLVDKYKESLDSAKDLYDYQKSVSDKAEEIAALQKQLAAYENDVTEETKAKIQTIKVELEEAKEDLQETEYEHMISEQKKMLDDLVDEYETTLNTRLDNIDALISDMIDQTNLNAVGINDTLHSVTEDVGYTMTSEMDSIWSKAAEAMNAGNETRIEQTQRLLDQMIAEGTLSREDANKIITALGTGDAQGITNAQNVITQLVSNGTITSDQASQLRSTVSSMGTSYNGVVTTYGSAFNSKQTTTNTTLGAIKSYVASMVATAQAEAQEAAQTVKDEQSSNSARDIAAAEAAKASGSTKDDAKNATVNDVPTSTSDTISTTSTSTRRASTTSTSTSTRASTTSTSTSTRRASTTSTSTSTKKATTTSTSTKKSTQGDGKLQVGDQVTFNKGSYYYSSDGLTPTGSKYHGKKVYITKINTKSWAKKPYHISTGKKLGKGDLGWVTKSQISGYAAGLKKAKEDETAWTSEDGAELIYKPSEGAILTNIQKGDSVFTADATENLWDLANDPSRFIDAQMRSSQPTIEGYTGSGVTVNAGDSNITITLPGVTNYDEFKQKMQNDSTFEKFIQSITVDRMVGKTRSSKYRFNF